MAVTLCIVVIRNIALLFDPIYSQPAKCVQDLGDDGRANA